ncbi:hypothetical protein [Propionimicrobium lymphophilum]|uniref:hypothetical protein n=1 Tax=Propionimicrobium lymphophilum TaxID=33012 RepID=UPI00041F9892|nr:hypothetical protein [Propionimicrobium lymphophilum]
MIKLKITSAICAALLAATVTGCSGDGANTEVNTTVASKTESSGAQTPATTNQLDTDGALNAIKKAEEVKDGVALSVSTEDNSHWEVAVLEGNEKVEYDVMLNGTVIETERETADAKDQKIKNGITLVEAIENAQGQAADGGKFLDEADFDEEDGKLGFAIDFDDAQGDDLDSFFADATGNISKK